MKPDSIPSHSDGSPDAELVQLAQRGEKRAFVEIVARHQAMVYGIAFGLLGDFAASEDAAQDAFLTAWRKIHDLREPERLRAWLGQISRTTALGYLRKQRGAVFVEGVLEGEDPAPQPDEAAASEEEAVLVREALAKLPEIFRLPLVLFYLERQSVRMVAEALDLSEDAVKQRLARGREMLRERMSGVIECALGRARPTAIFTMLIAVAIGALKAPAVIAGTVFSAAAASAASVTSAASAASTTSAASAATTTATAMSTPKTALTIAALIAAACLPLGYGARMGMESPPESASAREPQPVPAAMKPDFASSALYAEWKKLHDEHGSKPQDMPALYKAISDLRDPMRRRIFRAAQIAEWAEIDPAAGFAFFMEKSRDSAQRDQFFSEWLQRDAAAAVAALHGAGEGWDGLARKFLTEIAGKVPGSLAGLLKDMPKSDNYWSTEVRDAFAILSTGGLDAARAAAEGLTGAHRAQALAGVAMAWAKSDADAAIAWAKALPEDVDQNAVIRAAIMGLASANTASALDLVKSVPPGGREGYFADTTGARVLAEAAKADYDATVAWLAAHSGQMSREDMMGMAVVVTDRLNTDPAAFLARHFADGSLDALMPAVGSALLNGSGAQRGAIWEWLRTQPDNTALGALRREIINSAGYQDPVLAMKIAGDMPDTPEGRTSLDEIARSLFNGGQMLHRIDGLLATAPERLRQPLVDNFFQVLRGDTMDDQQKWLDLLPQVSGDKRSNATRELARAWAQQAPEEASAWAAALPEGEARTGAMGSAIGTWIGKDAWSASQYISTLPAGREKDNSAHTLVMTIAADSPAEAWEWALSIVDAGVRSGAVLHTMQSVAKRDPGAAQHMLDASNLPMDERTAIRTALAGQQTSGSGSSLSSPAIEPGPNIPSSTK